MDFWESAAPLRTRGGAVVASGIFFGLLGPLVHPFHIVPLLGTIMGYVYGFVPAVIAGILFGLLYRPDWRNKSSIKPLLYGGLCGLAACIFVALVNHTFHLNYPKTANSSFEGTLEHIRFIGVWGLIGGVVCGKWLPRRIAEGLCLS